MSKVKLAIIYYSSTGTNYQLAQWAAEGAKEADAEVRILKVSETAPESAIEKNPAWKKNAEATQKVKEATLEDLEWADAIIFSAPTRYGAIPAQLKHFLDSTGGLWAKGKLVNKVVSAMSSAMNPHGGAGSYHFIYLYYHVPLGSDCSRAGIYRSGYFCSGWKSVRNKCFGR